MDHFEIYIILLGIIVITGVLFGKTAVPTTLALVLTGMLLSFFPYFSHIELDPKLVLNFFLPILIYQISVVTSWRDVKQNFRPIVLLSVGHVLFITLVVAIVAHSLIPEIGWPLAFLLGAVVSPPDDVAIVSIAEKIHMPHKIVTILKGEGLLNDATALIIFRFSLAAAITHQFSAVTAVSGFFMVIIGETIYGVLLGFLIGKLRLKIREPVLQMMASFLTPFLAYLPPEKLGGSGVLATVVTGLIIEQNFYDKFKPEVRLLARSVWKTIAFAVEGILFLLVGLEMPSMITHISLASPKVLFLYSTAIIVTVIVGRFIWVYPAAYLPRFLFASIRKKDPYPRWQQPFLISWAGMRGGISLAAALAVPTLPSVLGEINFRDLLVFLVFCVIISTLILQGLALPWLLNILGIRQEGQREKYIEHLSELRARIKMIKMVLLWLADYKEQAKEDEKKVEKIIFHIQEYQSLQKEYKERLKNHGETVEHNEIKELREEMFVFSKTIEIERRTLLRLWRKEKISHAVKNKLIAQLDHRSNQI